MLRSNGLSCVLHKAGKLGPRETMLLYRLVGSAPLDIAFTNEQCA